MKLTQAAKAVGRQQIRWWRLFAGFAVAIWLHNAGAAGLHFVVMDAPPYGAQGAHGATGLYPAILQALSAQSHVPISVSVVPFARAAHAVASGGADGTLMFGTSMTTERVVQLAPVFVALQVVQPAPGIVLRSLADLRPLLIGRMRGGCQDLAADTAVPWRFHELNTQQQGIDMLKAKRIDVFCSTPEALDLAAVQHDKEHQLDPAARWVVSRKVVWLMLSQNVDPRVHEPLRAGIATLQQSGALARIFKAQLGQQFRLILPGAADSY